MSVYRGISRRFTALRDDRSDRPDGACDYASLAPVASARPRRGAAGRVERRAGSAHETMVRWPHSHRIERTLRARRPGRVARAYAPPSSSISQHGKWDRVKGAQRAVDSADLVDLLRRLASGDKDAFTAFYGATNARVYGMALRVLRDPGYTEETVQEVYLQVWRSAYSFDPARGSALSWLITLAHRRAIDRVRSEQSAGDRASAYGAAGLRAAFDEVSDEATRHEEEQAVVDCLDALTVLQRSSVDLAYYGGLTYRQVAERLQVALPTIKSRIRDGLARLRECLGGQSYA